MQSQETIAYSALLAESFKRWTGKDLIASDSTPEAIAEALDKAPFALVSHGTQEDPIFRYANKTALGLWEMSWEEFTALPSRRSAEAAADIQGDRNALLKEAMQKGWVDHYQGIRVSKTGKRFEITDTILWNVVDAEGVRHGQAAMIPKWKMLHAKAANATTPYAGRH